MVERLHEGVWHVAGSAANIFLAEDGDDLVLLDAGTPRDTETIRTAVADAGFSVGEIDRVLLTHYDYDHVGALPKLDDLGAPVYAHEPDASFLTGETRPGLWPHKALLQRVSGRFLSTPALPVERVTDGESVGSFTAYHTPGHAPGHLAWISEELETAFLGDLARESDGTLASSPRLVSYDTGEVKASLVDLADRAPPFEVVGMGHGTPIREGGDDALARLAEEISLS
jgi:glyoxylase-like metal-dependent hydrolase (beta-lactamase superfamily II)